MKLSELFTLESHGPDTFVGVGFPYPWGGLYGGHIISQALQAATHTVDEPGMQPHSLRAYFIRRGDNRNTVRYEVDRIRDGRTFTTRRVVARQSSGAILNLETSFQVPEISEDISHVTLPDNIERPDQLPEDSWMDAFERRMVPHTSPALAEKRHRGQIAGWFRVGESFGEHHPFHQFAIAFISDDLMTSAVRNSVPYYRKLAKIREETGEDQFFSVSLDHTVWFHRPTDTSKWHLYEASCDSFTSGRGVAYGHVFSETGDHVATVAQEVLVRVLDKSLKND